MAVEPDGAGESQTLGHCDLPFEIVADDPGLARLGLQLQKRVGIGGRLGLAERMLALDLVRGRVSADDAVVIAGSLYLAGEARSLFVQ